MARQEEGSGHLIETPRSLPYEGGLSFLWKGSVAIFHWGHSCCSIALDFQVEVLQVSEHPLRLTEHRGGATNEIDEFRGAVMQGRCSCDIWILDDLSNELLVIGYGAAFAGYGGARVQRRSVEWAA